MAAFAAKKAGIKFSDSYYRLAWDRPRWNGNLHCNYLVYPANYMEDRLLHNHTSD